MFAVCTFTSSPSVSERSFNVHKIHFLKKVLINKVAHLLFIQFKVIHSETQNWPAFSDDYVSYLFNMDYMLFVLYF